MSPCCRTYGTLGRQRKTNRLNRFSADDMALRCLLLNLFTFIGTEIVIKDKHIPALLRIKQLQLIQVLVEPVLYCYQLMMGAAFFYPSVFQHNDLIGIADGRQAVCYNK